MRFYSIKHVETKGIEEWEGNQDRNNQSYATTPHDGRSFWTHRFEKIGKECFETRAGAVDAGKDKLQKTLKGIDKRRSKILRLIGGLE